jgi:carboxypeptidase C (cathepsin A)
VDQEKVVGRFDARLAGFDPDPLGRDPDHDPSFHQFFAAYAGAFNDYARRGLKYESDVQYDVLTGRVQPWNFGRGGNGYLTWPTTSSGRCARARTPSCSVCSGVHDLATPYFAAGQTLRHMPAQPRPAAGT